MKISALAIFLSIPFLSVASFKAPIKDNFNSEVDGVIAKCIKIPTMEPSFKAPNKINTTNNLRKKTGEFTNANGPFIVLSGRLMDKNCLPITDANIEIWQTDSKGYKFLDKKYDYNFVGSGTAITDNLGRFSFLTVLPGSVSKIPGHINVQVKKKGFDIFKTRIFFDNKKSKDRLNARYIKGSNLDELFYVFDIVLNKESKKNPESY